MLLQVSKTQKFEAQRNFIGIIIVSYLLFITLETRTQPLHDPKNPSQVMFAIFAQRENYWRRIWES